MVKAVALRRVQGGDVASPTSRPGSTLVEAIVATVVFAAGFAGVAATASLAVRTLRAAEAEERAIAAAAAVLDSLLQLPSLTAGQHSEPQLRMTWTAQTGETTLLELVLEYHDATGPRRQTLAARQVPPPPRLAAP